MKDNLSQNGLKKFNYLESCALIHILWETNTTVAFPTKLVENQKFPERLCRLLIILGSTMSRMFFYVVKTSYCFVCKVIRTSQFISFKGCILLGETKET